MDADFQIGKGGINENLIKQVNDYLELNEIIKITLLENSLLDIKETCNELSKLTSSNPVQVIGKKFVLYKPSREHRKIKLPK